VFVLQQPFLLPLDVGVVRSLSCPWTGIYYKLTVLPLEGLPSAHCNASGRACFTLLHLDVSVYQLCTWTVLHLCVYCMPTRALCCCTWPFLSICWTWNCLVHKILCLFVSKPFYVCFGCFDTGSKHRNIPRNYVLVSWNKSKNNRNRLWFGSFRFFQFWNTLIWKNKSCMDIGKRSAVTVRNTVHSCAISTVCRYNIKYAKTLAKLDVFHISYPPEVCVWESLITTLQ